MIDIFVQREDALNRGVDITDVLITTIEVARNRGRMELDQQSSIREVELTTIFKTGVKLYDLVKVHDSFQSRIWTGMIVGLRKTITNNGAFMRLIIKRPTSGTIID